MKRTLLVCTIAMITAAAPALAQRGGGAKGHGGGAAPKPAAPHAQPVMKGGSSVKPARPVKTTTVRPATVKPAKGHATTVKTTGKPATVTSRPAGSPALSPVQLKLQRNTRLASRLQWRLPAGTNLEAAAAGFRNLGQFVAAVNVSNNLGIPFAQLKTRMIDQGMSLGQAIQDARPATTDTTVVVSRAEADADTLIRSTDTAKGRTKRGRK